MGTILYIIFMVIIFELLLFLISWYVLTYPHLILTVVFTIIAIFFGVGIIKVWIETITKDKNTPAFLLFMVIFFIPYIYRVYVIYTHYLL